MNRDHEGIVLLVIQRRVAVFLVGQILGGREKSLGGEPGLGAACHQTSGFWVSMVMIAGCRDNVSHYHVRALHKQHVLFGTVQQRVKFPGARSRAPNQASAPRATGVARGKAHLQPRSGVSRDGARKSCLRQGSETQCPSTIVLQFAHEWHITLIPTNLQAAAPHLQNTTPI